MAALLCCEFRHRSRPTRWGERRNKPPGLGVLTSHTSGEGLHLNPVIPEYTETYLCKRCSIVHQVKSVRQGCSWAPRTFLWSSTSGHSARTGVKKWHFNNHLIVTILFSRCCSSWADLSRTINSIIQPIVDTINVAHSGGMKYLHIARSRSSKDTQQQKWQATTFAPH